MKAYILSAVVALVTLSIGPGRASAASPFVGIPSSYVYNPRLGTLHDYCTHSPDQFPNPAGRNADFRGPCARHDLCLGGRTARPTCNARLRADMRTNCRHSYGLLNPARRACYRTADLYWAAVTAANPR